MNTDNVTISGETIDYGPCAFVDRYAADTVFSSIDHGGRYAFGNQPWIARWNLARFAEALLPLIDADQEKAIKIAEERLEQFRTWMNDAWADMMRAKLASWPRGRRPQARDGPLRAHGRGQGRLHQYISCTLGAAPLPTALDKEVAGWDDWKTRWDTRCGRTSGGELSPETRERMRRANPAVIPRNHRVEEALEAAVQSGDLEPFNRLLEAVQNPYEELPSWHLTRPCPQKRSPVILRPSAELSRREEPARTEPQTQSTRQRMFKRNLAIGQALLPLLVLEATITGFVVVDHLTTGAAHPKRKMLSPYRVSKPRAAPLPTKAMVKTRRAPHPSHHQKM